jgi:hypothetical protein
MNEYKFSGKLDTGREETPFERTVGAESIKHARENVLSELGSEHSVTRGKITLENEEEVQ